MVQGIRTVEKSLGHGRKEPAASEAGNREIIRRSVAVAHDVPEGAALRSDMLTLLRPAGGIPPAQLEEVPGRRPRRALRAGEILTWGDLE